MRIPRPPAPWLARLSPEPSGSTQETVLDGLRKVILSGYAAPGTSLPVDEVADRFDVSRIPVREALKTLIGEGLVEHRPRAGYTVAQLTPDELQQFYLVREVLEGAALRGSVELATAEDDALALQAHEALLQAVITGDPRAYHRQSRRFHLALLTPSRMQRLLHMFSSAWNITEPLQPMSYVPPADRALLHADHQQMLDAFVRRDGEALIAASQMHHRRLQGLIASLPRDTGLFSEEAVQSDLSEAATDISL
ncbi:GntR family transcriptional regulator [Jatrophihabitans sp. GAS493]|uniref:GntR family transcriptional regulator n=1 Tax=Jatrophihabitans sp. GAS493 TaxID=1907575 RepID=UPI000BB93898|nr:GntR family transcriptional regulator [Jatrophihabitans sp. GAS493]SOD74308.1 GntR family transcriptional regulator [Jatrophihabitans sp. GAS493]